MYYVNTPFTTELYSRLLARLNKSFSCARAASKYETVQRKWRHGVTSLRRIRHIGMSCLVNKRLKQSTFGCRQTNIENMQWRIYVCRHLIYLRSLYYIAKTIQVLFVQNLLSRCKNKVNHIFIKYILEAPCKISIFFFIKSNCITYMWFNKMPYFQFLIPMPYFKYNYSEKYLLVVNGLSHGRSIILRFETLKTNFYCIINWINRSIDCERITINQY